MALLLLLGMLVFGVKTKIYYMLTTIWTQCRFREFYLIFALKLSNESLGSQSPPYNALAKNLQDLLVWDIWYTCIMLRSSFPVVNTNYNILLQVLYVSAFAFSGYKMKAIRIICFIFAGYN